MTRFENWRFLTWLLTLALVGCSPSEQGASSGDEKSDTPQQAEDEANNQADEKTKVTLQILDDKQLEELIASKRGKVVVMDIWSTSCDPCIKEFPHFVEFSRKYPDRVACISLSLDYEGLGKPDDPDTKDPVLGFLQDQRATMDNVLSSVEIDTMLKRLKIAAPPTAFVFDTEGKLEKVFDDSNGKGFTYVEVEEHVLGLLETKK